jgi:hypothetical protein
MPCETAARHSGNTREILVRISIGIPDILTVFRGYPQFLQAKAGIAP